MGWWAVGVAAGLALIVLGLTGVWLNRRTARRVAIEPLMPYESQRRELPAPRSVHVSLVLGAVLLGVGLALWIGQAL